MPDETRQSLPDRSAPRVIMVEGEMWVSHEEYEALQRFAFGGAPEWEKANATLKHEARELRAENEALKERAENSEQALRKFQAGLTDTLRVYNVPAMPTWSEAIHWVAKNGSRAEFCACQEFCGDDGDIDGPGTCKDLPVRREPLVEIVCVPRRSVASDEQEATG